MSEEDFELLSFSDAPKIITKEILGPKCKELIGKIRSLESLTSPMPHPIIWADAKGATVKDPDGNIFVDMTAGVAVGNVGHCHPKVVEAVATQAKKVMHSAFPNPSKVRLLDKLSKIAPGGMKGNVRIQLALSGSEACELAVKFAKYYSKKFELVAFQGAYHGHTMGAVTMTTNVSLKKGIGPFVPYAVHAPYAYCYRCSFGKSYPDCDLQCIQYVQDIVEKPGSGLTEPGTLIVEPVQGEGGYIVPPDEFLIGLAKICKNNGLVFIDDETQAGFCRTGKMFAIEHSGVTPDLMVLGKALGNSLPVSAVVGKNEVMDTLGGLFQPATFSGNAVCCEAALAGIEVMEKNSLHERAAQLGESFIKSLKDLAEETRSIGDVRGRGLMIGVELVEDRQTKTPMAKDKIEWILGKMRSRGVLVISCGRWGHVIRFVPPLVITRTLISKAFEQFSEVIKEMEKQK